MRGKASSCLPQSEQITISMAFRLISGGHTMEAHQYEGLCFHPGEQVAAITTFVGRK